MLGVGAEGRVPMGAGGMAGGGDPSLVAAGGADTDRTRALWWKSQQLLFLSK